MFYQVEDIEFDFESDGALLNKREQSRVTCQVVGRVYFVRNEDELPDVISDRTGWCVRHLDYTPVLFS